MGKKTKKPGKGKEKTEKKTVKAEEKRARRETKKLSPEDDIDAILSSIQKEEAKKKEVHVEENVPAPSPRSNCTLSINPLKETELILYGGEFYNGNKTFVYGDLYRYDVEKQDWKLISSPNSPPPRSAHQAVTWKNYLYIFGGEFTSPNQERFHHYKDFWMLDLKTNQWEQLNLKGSPSPRSGHRMVLYKHKIIVFGGFYDTLREVRYHNDLFVFDLDQFKWQEITPRPGSLWPSARSGFQFFVYQDEIFLYGGYSKEVSSDKTGSEKGIVHSDLWSLDPRTWEWNKVKKSGMPPGPRAGFSMCVHKKRALLFGGVVDMEVGADVMMSLFLDELYGFQLDNHRWYPLELRKAKSTKDKPKKSSGRKRKNDDKINSIEPEECATNEKDENNEIDEEADDFESKVDGISHQMAKTITVGNDGLADESDGKINESSANLDSQDSDLPEVVKPCGRINSCMVVGRDTLYVYGGMMEIKDREITLDDLYSLNLSKLDEWKCIIPATETEWVEASEDEDEDEDDDDDSEDEGDEDSNSDETDDDNDEEHGKDGSIQMGDAVALIKGEGKSLRRKEKRARIEQIRASLGLSDSQRTPTPGETLREFYKRTNMYWQMAAHEHTQHTGKELRKDGFDLAEARYRELKPILDELAILEAEQKAEEQEPGQYPQTGAHPGYGPQQHYSKPPPYGMPSQAPTPQSYGPPRANQPGDAVYQGSAPPHSYGPNVLAQQSYPYASSGPAQQTYPAYGSAPAADGYSQPPPASGLGYPQQGGQPVSYGQPGAQQAAGSYGQAAPTAGYAQYPSSQQGYAEQAAPNAAGYGYQGSQDPGYGAAPAASYGAPAAAQPGYTQPAAQQNYDQSIPQSAGYGAAPPAASAGYGKTVSPQPGYPQYDSSQMYAAAPR